MKRTTVKLVVPVMLLAIAGLACLQPAVQPSPSVTPPPAEENKAQSEANIEKEKLPTFPITVVDDVGRQVTIPHLPQRIISLAPSNTEILFALGLEERIVGVTDYCDYPEAAKAKPRVAGYSTPNIEKLVSLEPDLIIAESIHERVVVPALEKLGLTVFVTSATSLDSVLHDIEVIGQITGRSSAASRLADSLETRINAVASRTAAIVPEQRPRVLYVCWHAPIWTMGAETFIDDLIWKAGGKNVFRDDFKKSRAVSLEAVIDKNPEIIIVSGMGTTGDLIYSSILGEERLKGVDALVNKRVYKISDANLIERPGPRIADGLEEVAGYIHPEMFGKSPASTR